MQPYIVNLFGLLFDITGVILLFKYGLPSEVSKDGITDYVEGAPEEKEVKKWLKYKIRSKVALIFLILGFVFQTASTVLFMTGK